MTSFKISTTLPRLTLAAFLLAGCFTQHASVAQNLPTLGDTGREDLSPVLERNIGEEIMFGIRQDKDYIDDEPAVEFINQFGYKLLEVHQEARGEANYDFYFFSVRDPVLNAFALPGGFIGVHSALINAAETESELASVLSHEIGHVAQRHIARMIGNQKQDAIIPIATMILAALLIRSNPDAAIATVMSGEGIAIQRQLNFSQNAEREADRVGLQILRDGGYDPTGMVAFFKKMQNNNRGYSDNVPAFLRTHPLTSERIADIESRIRNETFKKHDDSPDYQFFRARIRVLQDTSTQGLLDSRDYFEAQLKLATSLKKTNSAADYGLAFIAFKQGNFKEAQHWLDKAMEDAVIEEKRAHFRVNRANSSAPQVEDNGIFILSGSNLTQFDNALSAAHQNTNSVFFTSLKLDILLLSKQNKDALEAAENALKDYPTSLGIGRQYADALIANNRVEQAITYLRDQTLLYRKEFRLQNQLAKAYAAANKECLQHLALAESLALQGAISPSIDQLQIARRATDGSFYDHAMIDAKERDLKERFKDQLEAERKAEEKHRQESKNKLDLKVAQ